MRSQVIWCLALNFFSALISVGSLYFIPANRGFTFTSGTTTHFLQSGPLVATLLTICVSILIAVYLTFRVYVST